MRKLIDVPNIEAVTGDYPKGRVRDKVGAVPGTTLVEILNGDSIQLFQKLIVDASITENNTPDNVSNGYQLLDALIFKIQETAVQRSSNQTALIATATTTEQDFMTITPSATRSFDDVKVDVSFAAGWPGATDTLTVKLYINGVEKQSIGLDGSTGNDEMISFSLAGETYTATDIIKVTVKTAISVVNLSAQSIIVEAINNN